MSLSAANVSKDKSIQEEARSDSTMVKKPVNIVGASPSLENRTKESNELKTEMKDPKKDEETEKRKISQLKNENLPKTQKQDSKLAIVESKTIETKKETKKKEVVVPKVSSTTTATQTFVPKFKMIPIYSTSDAENPSNVAVPRKTPPLLMPVFNERPLVLTTHLVPSLPISLFQVLIEAIEVATEKPVVLLYESRSDRPVAKDIADIAILPAGGEWEDGKLLPVSFCFEHHLNKENSPCVYADVIVATDRAPHVEDITDLRGHRCSLPDRRNKIGAAALLFNFLYTRGEGPAFFGNTLDAETQLATLQMVAGSQAEIGILESPVIKCHKNNLPGMNSLHILTSLGPLPPYRIMVRKTLSDALMKKITTYLLNIGQDKEWVDKFAPFGVTSFTKNSEELYDFTDVKSAVTSVRYY